MKFLKGLFAFFLIIIIVGGIGFLGYNIYMGNLFDNMNMSMNGMENTSGNPADSTTQDASNSDGMYMSGMDGNTDTTDAITALPNPYDAENREKLGEAIDLINDALELITIDPYSNATVPDSSMQMDSMQGQTTQNSGLINIYPSDSSTVNIMPEVETDDAEEEADAQSTMGSMSMEEEMSDSVNRVYDQTKLQQLHSGIYTIAQGVLTINELSDDLLTQSMALEQQPFTYQTYVNRYNTALQNQAALEKAMILLDQASVLINVNPYASDSGYSYNSNSMKQLHEGIFQYAQGMALLESLNDDFINQMTTASASAQNLVSMGTMDMSSSSTGVNLLGSLNMGTLFNIILIVLIICLIIGLLGSVLSLIKHKPHMNNQ